MHVVNDTTKHTPKRVHIFSYGEGGRRMDLKNYHVPMLFPTCFHIFSMVFLKDIPNNTSFYPISFVQ
jgi:hypothetical protein